MTYLEHRVTQKLAREERVGLVYRWLTAFATAFALSLILLALA